ncbi:MAG: sigma-54 dependent transcriptional regulator [Candidatus Latescibacteria bacterium]|nr:sigma-54 dependent transcriptional regulator [Candidatus Latescibacterota bacterium]
MNDNHENGPFDFGELNILVVDDQEDVRRGLSRLVESFGFYVEMSASAEDALVRLKNYPFDMVITDLQMGGMSGDQLLPEIKWQWPDIEVVMITGFGTIELAVSCLQNGAAHFITKPFENKDILAFVKQWGHKILSRRQSRMKLDRYRGCSIISADPRMQDVLSMIDQIAPTSVPVLIEGASGTGKELVAHEIHNRSNIRDKPFLAINCIALPDSLLESELFGYKKGSFTGAHKDTGGLFEQAEGGTIFLDEIASMSPSFQGKLLRVLQEKVVRPLGGDMDIPVDFRLIAATNRNLEKLINSQDFREDLFYRLQVVKITLPTLNERPECIPVLAEYFLNRAATELMVEQHICPEITPDTMNRLIQHEWKGHVRELENTIYRAVVMCNGDKLLPSHLGFAASPSLAETSSENSGDSASYEASKQKAIDVFQRGFIQNALRQTRGNISKASELSGMTRAAFQRIMRKLEIETE